MTTIPEYAKGENTFAPAPDSGKEILDSYALTLGLHALGIPVQFKEVPEYKCKDATTPLEHA